MREPEAQQNQLISGFENQNPFIAKFVCTDMEFDCENVSMLQDVFYFMFNVKCL